MNSKQQTYTDQINEFRNLLIKYNRNPTMALRSSISKSIHKIQQIANKAGTMKLVTIAPPPMIGGYKYSNANPFDMIFEAPYGMDLTTVIIDILDATLGVIESEPEFSAEPKSIPAVKQKKISSNKIFLVHGHDNELKEKTARYLEKMGLEVIILHEQSNQGQTIIEKFEAHADVGFAVVLLTPDDVGRSIKVEPDQQRFRARQNVIFELGYFIGRIGRDKVCGILKGPVETPSDYDGVLYIQYDEADGWKLLLAKELKQAGLKLDINKAFQHNYSR
ncbi:nucleotide-binding protein [Mucilaginibacter sp.]|uniref:nucleotide-binding protein n=1 Tax=Mucilaginibacter sp. TaxID=1882438 RepID=UPI00260C726F|nr:nucleotide-binding protein [Mucilaginibacter sp.]